MRVNRATAAVLGLLTVAPWGYMVYFVSRVTTAFTAARGPSPTSYDEFQTLIRLHMLVMALILGLLVFYIVHLFRTERVAADKKTLWAVVLFLGNLLAMPVYWYLYVWPRRPEGAA